VRNYFVFWTYEAEAMLTDIYSTTSASEPVADAVYEFELDLSNNPFEVGESRESPFLRVAFRPPIGIAFEVSEIVSEVVVQAVWLI
jgi:hypothetical protein